jgi:cellulose synthase/poly-beta-1,6-N-acetylglucosamine synthase-like glycosyltransferase
MQMNSWQWRLSLSIMSVIQIIVMVVVFGLTGSASANTSADPTMAAAQAQVTRLLLALVAGAAVVVLFVGAGAVLRLSNMVSRTPYPTLAPVPLADRPARARPVHAGRAANRATAQPAALHWKITLALSITVFVVVSLVLGITVFNLIGGAIAVTFYGVVTVLRKIVQIDFARNHNRFARLLTRKPLIEALVEAQPHLEERAYLLLRKPTQFEAFKDRVLALLGEQFDEITHPHDAANDPYAELTRAADRQLWLENCWREMVANSFPKEALPLIGVVIPTYRTSHEELQELVQSLALQTYPNVRAVIVINEINEEMENFAHWLAAKYGNGRFAVLVEPRRGKRNAMQRGFQHFLDADEPFKYIFNVDSDTKIHIDAVANAVRMFEADPSVKCLTGDIRVVNGQKNLLTRLTYQRYFFAFNVERAAQSLFHAVTCMSGPFMGVRADALRLIVNAWANQYFLGRLCNFGDDRHLSTLVLQHGWGSGFCPDSICWTTVPEEVGMWKRQQTRWARSAWRETIISLPWLHRLPLWVVFDTIYLSAFPFVLVGTVTAVLLRALSSDIGYLLIHLGVVTTLLFIFHSLYGWLANRDYRYIINPVYLFHQFVWLLPLKFWALLSLHRTEWGTK